MKNKQYGVSRTKKELLNKKRNGVKEVIWKVDSQETRNEILRLGFSMTPWLFEIQTKPFKNVRALKSTLLKDVHYAFKRGKSKFVCRLDSNDCQLLSDYGVQYRPIKYKITLV